jgi:hypothetical protein
VRLTVKFSLRILPGLWLVEADVLHCHVLKHNNSRADLCSLLFGQTVGIYPWGQGHCSIMRWMHATVFSSNQMERRRICPSIVFSCGSLIKGGNFEAMHNSRNQSRADLVSRMLAGRDHPFGFQSLQSSRSRLGEAWSRPKRLAQSEAYEDSC